jgi:hypothetical protein
MCLRTADLPRSFLCLKTTVALALAVHIVLVLHHFNMRLQFERGLPLTSGDLSFHFAGAMEGVEFLHKRHVLWGYSPSFMAGYPFGLWNSASHRGYEIAASLLPFATPELAYYVFIVAVAVTTPLVLNLACPALGIIGRSRWFVLLLALWLFQFDAEISSFWTIGNIIFPSAAALAVVFTAVVWGSRDGLLGVLGAGLLLGVIFWFHPLGVVPAAVGGAVATAFRTERWPRRVIRLALIAVTAAAIASPWLIPLLRFRDIRSPMAVLLHQSSLKHAVMDLLSDRGYTHPYDRRALLHILLVLAVLGAFASFRARQFGPVICFIAGCAVFALTYTVGYVSFLKQLQPSRFVVAYEWFWVMPAAEGALLFLRLLRKTNREGYVVAACLALAMLPSLTAYGVDLVARRPARGLSAEGMASLECIKADGTRSGRVLCDDIELGNLIPYLANREVIGGGLSSQAVVRNGWTCVDNERAFGRPLAELTANKLAAYLSLYNITHAIVRTDALKARLASLPGTCSPIGDFGHFSVFTVKPEQMDGIWQGVYDGRIRAQPDRIVIAGAPHGGFTINYHYLRSLRADKGVGIRPVQILDDPVPFIRVENSGSQGEIVLSNATE